MFLVCVIGPWVPSWCSTRHESHVMHPGSVIITVFRHVVPLRCRTWLGPVFPCASMLQAPMSACVLPCIGASDLMMGKSDLDDLVQLYKSLSECVSRGCWSGESISNQPGRTELFSAAFSLCFSCLNGCFWVGSDFRPKPDCMTALDKWGTPPVFFFGSKASIWCNPVAPDRYQILSLHRINVEKTSYFGF